MSIIARRHRRRHRLNLSTIILQKLCPNIAEQQVLGLNVVRHLRGRGAIRLFELCKVVIEQIFSKGMW